MLRRSGLKIYKQINNVCLRNNNKYINKRICSTNPNATDDVDDVEAAKQKLKETLGKMTSESKTHYGAVENESQESEQKSWQNIDPDKQPNYLEDDYLHGFTGLNFQGMMQPKHVDYSKKEPLTDLAKEIKRQIYARGPITLAKFMELCMQDPKFGYYMTKDPIGKDGDFITTPEIYSGFGECLAIWCALAWENMGKPQKIKIIEFGPGLGTVAKAVLDFARLEPMKDFKNALSIHLIESSPRLRYKQKEQLGLTNIRKFKKKVKKTTYAVTNDSPYDTIDNNKGPKLETDYEETRKGPKKPVISPDDDDDRYSDNTTNTSKKKKSPIIDPSDPNASSKVVGSNPFKLENIFGSLGNRAYDALSRSGGGNKPLQLTDEMKDKIPPFDWSLHHPGILPKELMDDDMKDYFSGKKYRDWKDKQKQIQTPTTDTNNDDSKRETKRQKEERLAREYAASMQDNTNDNDTTNEDNNENNNDLSDKAKELLDLLNYEDLMENVVESEEEVWQGRTKDGILLSWHNCIESIDGDQSVIMCHEFFDALPVSHFEYRLNAWAETLVDVDDDDDSPLHFKLLTGKNALVTFAASILDRQMLRAGIKPGNGQQYSVMPLANEISKSIAKYLKKYGGVGFLIDYGSENPPAWTLQGVKEHKFVNILSEPGNVDISAHVNFNAIKTSMESIDGIKTYGPVTQSYFLQGCGIVHRYRQYLNNNLNGASEDERNEFIKTFGKIMDLNQLGGHFKCLGFGNDIHGIPLGFRTPISPQQAKTDPNGVPIYDKEIS